MVKAHILVITELTPSLSIDTQGCGRMIFSMDSEYASMKREIFTLETGSTGNDVVKELFSLEKGIVILENG